MSGTDDEIQRLQRIRDQQLAARDPSVTRKNRYERVHKRQSSNRKSMTTGDVVRTFSYKIIGLIVGILLGFIAWVVMTLMLDAPWVDMAGLVLIVLLAGSGTLVGASFDWRDNLRDF